MLRPPLPLDHQSPQQREQAWEIMQEVAQRQLEYDQHRADLVEDIITSTYEGEGERQERGRFRNWLRGIRRHLTRCLGNFIANA